MATEIVLGQHFIYQETTTESVNGKRKRTTRRYRACVEAPHREMAGWWWIGVPALRDGWVVMPEGALRARLDASQYDPAPNTPLAVD